MEISDANENPFFYGVAGQPLVNPDGSAVVYNPTLTSQQGRSQQPMAPPPPPPHLQQHQPTNHVVSQVSPASYSTSCPSDQRPMIYFPTKRSSGSSLRSQSELYSSGRPISACSLHPFLLCCCLSLFLLSVWCEF